MRQRAMRPLRTTGVGLLLWAFVSLASLNFLLEMNLLQRIGISTRCLTTFIYACSDLPPKPMSSVVSSDMQLLMSATCLPPPCVKLHAELLSSPVQQAHGPAPTDAAFRGPRGDVPPRGSQGVLLARPQGEEASAVSSIHGILLGSADKFYRRDFSAEPQSHIPLQAAGSTVCQLAEDNGELLFRENNCNLCAVGLLQLPPPWTLSHSGVHGRAVSSFITCAAAPARPDDQKRMLSGGTSKQQCRATRCVLTGDAPCATFAASPHIVEKHTSLSHQSRKTSTFLLGAHPSLSCTAVAQGRTRNFCCEREGSSRRAYLPR